jgi:hypothetical protein
MRKMNDSAQWQLIEVILVAGILFAAMYLVRSSNITVYKSIEEETPLKAQGYGALESLASQPPPAGYSGDYRSLLEYYVKNPSDDLKNAIEGFFLSSDVNFKIDRIDMVQLKNEQATLAACTTPLVGSYYWIDEKSCTVTRIVEHCYYDNVLGTYETEVYKVVLYLWYNT